MVLVRQPTTAGFRPISKYKYIVPPALKVLNTLILMCDANNQTKERNLAWQVSNEFTNQLR